MSQADELFRLQEEASIHMDTIDSMVKAGEPEEEVLLYSQKLTDVNIKMANLLKPAQEEIIQSLDAIKIKKKRLLIIFACLAACSLALLLSNLPINS